MKTDLGGRIARLPWTKEEVRAHLKRRYESDEQALIRLLAAEDSKACGIYANFRLTRAIIKSVFGNLDHQRKIQMCFASMVCGTAFKYYNPEGVRLRVKCPVCGDAYSFRHLQTHCPHQQPEPGSEEDMVNYLSTLSKLIAPISPNIPVPYTYDAVRSAMTTLEGPATPQRSASNESGQCIAWPPYRTASTNSNI